VAAEHLPTVAGPAGQRRPRVSIVMPTFRRAGVIAQTIRSLLDQTYGDFELLVRDDDGEDGTGDVVRGLGDARVRYHRNPERLRMPGNLNSGIREAVGEYVLVCHDHDLYAPTLVARMVEVLDAHPSALFVHCGAVGVDDSGRTVENWVQDLPVLTNGERWLHRMLENFSSPVTANSMVRRSAHEQYGLYDPDYGFVADVEMWMRLSRRGDVAYVAEPLLRLRAREADHEFTGASWPLLEILMRIQRRYHREMFHGPYGVWRRARLWLRTENLLLRRYVGTIVRREHESRAEGRRCLRASGTVFARLTAWAI
jgi:glycosyltransferase involved in cell wall biosynthesis